MFGSTRKRPQEHDPAEALVREVGIQLRQAREVRGEDLETVAKVLRIRPTYLFGLEQGDLAVMPGRTYALGFLRSYAQYLGFDGDDLITQIRSSVADLTGGADLHGRTALSESRLPKVPILVVSLAALAGIYVGWAYIDGSDRAEIEVVAEVPQELLMERVTPPEVVLPPVPREAPQPAAEPQPPTAMAPVDVTTSQQAPAALDQVPSAPPGEQRAAAIAPVPSAPAVDVAEVVASAPAPGSTEPAPVIAEPGPPLARVEPAASGQEAEVSRRPAAEILAALAPVAAGGTAPQIYRTDDARTRVILRALDNAWVHVSSTNNDYLWVKTLKPGDAFVVPDRPDLVLWTGNAGGVEVIVDGTPLPPLGADADVVRDVSLQPSALLHRLLPAPAAAPGL